MSQLFPTSGAVFPTGGAAASETFTFPADLSGNGNAFVNVAGTTEVEKAYSVPLRGTSYGKINNDASFDTLSAFTVLVNIRRNRRDTDGEVFCLPAGPTWVPPYARIRLFVGGRNAQAAVEDAVAFTISSANIVDAGPWHQLGLCWDGTSKVARLVVNGASAGTVTTTGISQLTTTSQNIYIGDIGVTPYQAEIEFGELAMFNVNKGLTWFTDVWTEQNPEGAGQKRVLPDADDGSGWADMTGRIIHIRGGGETMNPIQV